MLTSRDGMLSQVRGRIAGATEYLTKPFKTQEVIEVVSRFLKPDERQTHPTYRSQAW
jgi:twitching motility two-component system response regulator PilG